MKKLLLTLTMLLFVRCDISGKTVLQHFEGKVKKDLMLKATLDGDLISF